MVGIGVKMLVVGFLNHSSRKRSFDRFAIHQDSGFASNEGFNDKSICILSLLTLTTTPTTLFPNVIIVDYFDVKTLVYTTSYQS